MPAPSKRPVRRMGTAAPVDEDEAPAEDGEEARPTKRVSRPTSQPEGTENMLHRGWSAGQKEFDSTSNYAQALKLDEKGVVIKFLEDDPYASFRRHWIERTGPNGRVTRAYLCLKSIGEDCPLCEAGDKPQAVSAFNVAILGDDGQVTPKSWDVGVRLFKVLEGYAHNQKIAPLTKGYFLVNKTGQKQNVQYNVIPVSARTLTEEHEIDPPSQAALDKVERYTADIIERPKRKDLDEIAAEIQDDYD